MAETTHKNLAEALLAFKAEVPALPKDKVNPHFKSRYTPLDTIAEHVDPLLTKHGLVWVALPGHLDGRPTLDYQLIHAASGEVLAGSMMLMLEKENSQGLGSALTYTRRYAKVAVLDLVADEDDDGNAASRPAQARATNGNTSRQPESRPAQSNGERLASAAQRGLLNGKAGEAGLSAEQFAAALCHAAGQEARGFDTDEAAQQFVNRQLDRLPARLVDKVLEEINNESVPF